MEETQMVVKKESGDDHQMKQEKSSPSIKLGLGIGGVDEVGGGGGGVGNKRCCGLFTAVQLHELEQQALIYKHIAAALPVPLNLLVPIWKSVVTSFGSANGAAAIYKQYPSFIGFSPLGFEYRNAMDPEPGRCRRTDGKKWRCGKSVVPDQKYCQQHMHRGRNRSRKPVEASEIASPPDTKTPKNSEGEKWNSKTNLQISTPKGLQFMAQSSNDIRVSPGTTTTSTSYQECKKNISSVTSVTATPITNTLTNRTAKAPAAAATTTAATTAISNKNNLNIGVKDNSSNNAGDSYCIIRGSSNNRNHINVGTNISPGTPGLGFSPKSVLQGRRAILLGCNGLCFDNRSGIEPEPGRCRRTDGKKWRCRRDVLLDQKYCDRHIHRGAKQMKTSQPVAVPSASAAAMNTAQLSQTTAIPTAIPRRTDCATPNTNLTISIPASPPPIQDDEKSNPSSDSDTTITDTSLTAHEHSYVSS